MRAFVRAAFAAALVLLLSVAAIAADKVFKRADLADASIKLEAQIKAESGAMTKPIAALRRRLLYPLSAFQQLHPRGRELGRDRAHLCRSPALAPRHRYVPRFARAERG